MARKRGRPRKAGRPRKHKGGQSGGRLFDGSLLRKANKWLKDNKAISRTARALGYNTVGNAAAWLGYGQSGGSIYGTARNIPTMVRY